MRVLLVEDETAIANFIAEGLEEEGFAVDVAYNGKEGLRLALDYLPEYDLILLDWMLPGLSGIEICRAIRKENKTVPVVFLTANRWSSRKRSLLCWNYCSATKAKPAAVPASSKKFGTSILTTTPP